MKYDYKQSPTYVSIKPTLQNMTMRFFNEEHPFRSHLQKMLLEVGGALQIAKDETKTHRRPFLIYYEPELKCNIAVFMTTKRREDEVENFDKVKKSLASGGVIDMRTYSYQKVPTFFPIYVDGVTMAGRDETQSIQWHASFPINNQVLAQPQKVLKPLDTIGRSTHEKNLAEIEEFLSKFDRNKSVVVDSMAKGHSDRYYSEFISTLTYFKNSALAYFELFITYASNPEQNFALYKNEAKAEETLKEQLVVLKKVMSQYAKHGAFVMRMNAMADSQDSRKRELYKVYNQAKALYQQEKFGVARISDLNEAISRAMAIVRYKGKNEADVTYLRKIFAEEYKLGKESSKVFSEIMRFWKRNPMLRTHNMSESPAYDYSQILELQASMQNGTADEKLAEMNEKITKNYQQWTLDVQSENARKKEKINAQTLSKRERQKQAEQARKAEQMRVEREKQESERQQADRIELLRRYFNGIQNNLQYNYIGSRSVQKQIKQLCAKKIGTELNSALIKDQDTALEIGRNMFATNSLQYLTFLNSYGSLIVSERAKFASLVDEIEKMKKKPAIAKFDVELASLIYEISNGGASTEKSGDGAQLTASEIQNKIQQLIDSHLKDVPIDSRSYNAIAKQEMSQEQEETLGAKMKYLMLVASLGEVSATLEELSRTVEPFESIRQSLIDINNPEHLKKVKNLSKLLSEGELEEAIRTRLGFVSIDELKKIDQIEVSRNMSAKMRAKIQTILTTMSDKAKTIRAIDDKKLGRNITSIKTTLSEVQNNNNEFESRVDKEMKSMRKRAQIKLKDKPYGQEDIKLFDNVQQEVKAMIDMFSKIVPTSKSTKQDMVKGILSEKSVESLEKLIAVYAKVGEGYNQSYESLIEFLKSIYYRMLLATNSTRIQGKIYSDNRRAFTDAVFDAACENFLTETPQKQLSQLKKELINACDRENEEEAKRLTKEIKALCQSIKAQSDKTKVQQSYIGTKAVREDMEQALLSLCEKNTDVMFEYFAKYKDISTERNANDEYEQLDSDDTDFNSNYLPMLLNIFGKYYGGNAKSGSRNDDIASFLKKYGPTGGNGGDEQQG